MPQLLPQCRHVGKNIGKVCELQPGVLFCPCFGRDRDRTGRFSIDSAGQVIWTALGDQNQPTFYHTLVALRRDPETNQVRAIALKQVEDFQTTFSGAAPGTATWNVEGLDGAAYTIVVDELMRRALGREEFVLLNS
jgi:hypothetical protein